METTTDLKSSLSRQPSASAKRELEEVKKQVQRAAKGVNKA